jgi:2-methylcitrate dehydratase
MSAPAHDPAMSSAPSTVRPPPDRLLVEIADYVLGDVAFSAAAYDTARHCLMDSLGCGLQALAFPACTRHLGPLVPGATLAGGARVPGTSYELDPVHAAFNIGCMIRWLDFNDTWLAAEWGHPSDNLGGILSVADYLCRSRGATLDMGAVLAAMIQAHEIQGVLALRNAFNRVGLDHVILVKVASIAVVTRLLGGTRSQIIDALSQAWVDGHPLRTYRHAPNAGPRKSWAAGDATARAVRLALMTLAGEIGLPSCLSAPRWGFQDALFQGRAVERERPFASYVMENVLFKISFPAEFHAQTAVEAAIRLHALARTRLDGIAQIRVSTHEAALRIIVKDGPLSNPADRDHCLQYMIAIGLLEGTLIAAHYEDAWHRDHPAIDRLRARTVVVEDPAYSRDYLDPAKRSIANAIQLVYSDGSQSERVEVEYPLGHRRRRAEGIPLLEEKFAASLQARLPAERCAQILALYHQPERLVATPVDAFMGLFQLP